MEAKFAEWKQKYGIYLAVLVIIILAAIIFFQKGNIYNIYQKGGETTNVYQSSGDEKGAPDYNAPVEKTGSLNTYLVTTYAAGNGAGTIVAQGINCGAGGIDCDEKVEANKLFTLYVYPSSGSIFVGWLGSCTGTGDCRLFMDSAKQVTAIFNVPGTAGSSTNGSAPRNGTGGAVGAGGGAGAAGAAAGPGTPAGGVAPAGAAAGAPTTYTLTISKPGAGSGSVTSSPSGINCGATCSYSYSSGTSVSLTPTATAGSAFSSWSGCDSVSGITCQVSMSRSKTVVANFAPFYGGATSYTLTASVSGNKSGSLTSSPAGINCPPTCSSTFTSGTSVTLSPVVGEAGAFLESWGGACSGVGAVQCIVTMSSSKSVSVKFTSSPGDALTIYRAGTGSGTVTSNPARINCPTTCASYFNFATVVTLTATPAAGSSFTGWSGACSGAALTCSVTMTDEKTVTATFAVTPTYTLSIDKGGNGTGSVNSDDGGIKCGTYCSQTYPSGTSVHLTTEPSVGSVFSSWSGGGCSGAGDCTVVMDSSKSVDATFTKLTMALSLEKLGNGDGKVTSNPYEIHCETGCKKQTAGFAYGTSVTISLTPYAGSSFAGWGGACAGVGAVPSCTLSMTSAKSVTATFNSP